VQGAFDIDIDYAMTAHAFYHALNVGMTGSPFSLPAKTRELRVI
jgi:hypothetical protein